MGKGVLHIHRLILKIWDFHEKVDTFEVLQISRCFRNLRRVHRLIRHIYISSLVQYNRHMVNYGPSGVWRLVILLDFEEWSISLRKLRVQNR